MSKIIKTEIPTYAVIFSSQLAEEAKGYAEMAEQMLALAMEVDGFLYQESVRDGAGKGISISYWRDMEAISVWKKQAEHQAAQRIGREKWYRSYRVQVCKLEREYSFDKDA